MRLVAVLAVAVLSGCAGASGLTIANGVGLGVQSAALACDWQQTRRFAEAGWPRWRDPRDNPRANVVRRPEESNPILGHYPSTARVDFYFVGALAASLLGWWALPRRWRLIVPLAVTALQIKAVTTTVNRDHGFQPGLCGTSVMR